MHSLHRMLQMKVCECVCVYRCYQFYFSDPITSQQNKSLNGFQFNWIFHSALLFFLCLVGIKHAIKKLSIKLTDRIMFHLRLKLLLLCALHNAPCTMHMYGIASCGDASICSLCEHRHYSPIWTWNLIAPQATHISIEQLVDYDIHVQIIWIPPSGVWSAFSARSYFTKRLHAFSPCAMHRCNAAKSFEWRSSWSLLYKCMSKQLNWERPCFFLHFFPPDNMHQTDGVSRIYRLTWEHKSQKCNMLLTELLKLIWSALMWHHRGCSAAATRIKVENMLHEHKCIHSACTLRIQSSEIYR